MFNYFAPNLTNVFRKCLVQGKFMKFLLYFFFLLSVSGSKIPSQVTKIRLAVDLMYNIK